MKKIMVAIDFSKTSLNALDYAIMLAEKAGSDILMVWVDNTTSEEAVYEGNPAELRVEKIEHFKELIAEHGSKLKGNKLEYKTKKGKVYIEIANLARTSGVDLLIAGTHGVSGFEEFWIGSNAYRIVTHSPSPVISLRLDYKIRPIKKIVLPIDSSQETRQKTPMAAQIAKLFNSEIHILSLYTTGLKSVKKRVDNYAAQMANYLEDREISFVRESVESDNVTKTTIEYSGNVDADLVAIMTEQETTTANLFLGPYAQQMVNHSPIPILSVRSKELVRIPTE
jgi:nucleotide-binding universal stress UspA family protein